MRSPIAAPPYRTRSSSTDSLRVAMLIRLVTSCCSRRTIQRVANYVKQQVISGNNSDESIRFINNIERMVAE